MSYYLGPVLVDESANIPSQVFPITSQRQGWQRTQSLQVVAHQFGSGDSKIEQRFYLGPGKQTFVVNLQPMSPERRTALLNFWTVLAGPTQAFYYDAPNDDGQATTRYTVIFDPEQSLAITNASDLISSTAVTLLVIPTSIPSYSVGSVNLRFPSTALQSQLLQQQQELIPLITIIPRYYSNSNSRITFGSIAGPNINIFWTTNLTTKVALYAGNPTNPSAPISPYYINNGTSGTATIPFFPGAEYVLTDALTGRVLASNVYGGTDPIYISDRNCIVNGVTYHNRFITHQGIAQHLGPSDDATITLANADHAFTKLKNLVNLQRASISFDLYHIRSQILLQFWKGEIKDWTGDEGPSFDISCSDIIYELQLPYPTRTITRDCWKPFNLEPFCPYASQGSGGDPTFCDKGFDTLSGCQSHGMDNFFGGVVANPQAVTIRDNGSSGRPTITVTSIASDTMYGRALQEIYTDIPMPVPCIIADGRDESDFYEAIGIIGAGPILQFGAVQNQLLDGQTQNYPYSPITVFGNDPEPTPFSLDAGGRFQYPYKAAGVARISIRRTDTKGIQPSTPDSHSMVAEVAQGLKGLIWFSPGVNNGGPTMLLTNPAWIAINAFLKALGLGPGASVPSQESVFDVNSSIAVAAICDTYVQTLVYNRNPVQLPVDGLNTGIGNWTPIDSTQPQLPTELQYQFRGVIRDQYPLRQWLDQIMINCLGFWYTVYGKLFLGIRTNASAAEAFTVGNMIWKSYSEKPINPEYNDLTASFADQDFRFAQNTCRYYDEGHAKALGTNVSPRYEKGQINLPGICNASQALRVTATRCREEIGGVNEFEWKNARVAQWKTTVLALNCFPGQVVSVTHPDTAGGYGKFRIQSLTLGPDYSITIQGTTVTDSMYDLSIGPKPTDVAPPWLPVIPNIETNAIPCWIPAAISRSAVITYPIQSAFFLTRSIATLTDGSTRITFTLTGDAPITTFFTQSQPVLGSLSESANPGPFTPGVPWYLAITGVDASGQISAPSKTHVIVPSLTSGGSIVLSGMTFPTGSVNYIMYSGTSADTLTAVTLRPLESSLTLAGNNPQNHGAPIYQWNNIRVRIKAKRISANSFYTVAVSSVDNSANRIYLPTNSIPGGVGLFISVLGQLSDFTVPLADYSVINWINDDGSPGHPTYIDVSPIPGHNLSDFIHGGDLILLRYDCKFATATSISAGSVVNLTSFASFSVNEFTGKLVRIIGGYGAGQVRQIVSNDIFGNMVLSTPWDIIPSYFLNYFPRQPTSIFIIEDADTLWTSDSEIISNPVMGAQLVMPITVPDLPPNTKMLLLTGVITSEGYESDNVKSIYREVLVA